MAWPEGAIEMSVADITLNDEQCYTDNGITLHLNKKVAQIQPGDKKVITAQAYNRHPTN